MALPLGLLVLVVLGAGVFWFVAHQAHPGVSRAPLYINSLTTDQHAWHCDPGATCQFEPTGLHILAPTDHLYFSILSGQRFEDQVINVQGELDQGDPQLVGLSIAFRSVGLNGYGWLVFANGTYELLKWDDQGTASPLLPLTHSPAIHPGLNQINQLTIIAAHNQITLMSNGQRLTQITDGTYGSGTIALGAARTSADAVFTHLSVTRP